MARLANRRVHYDIEWKVLIDKEPIIGDLIRRSDFRLNSLCLQAKGKAQDRVNSKDKNAVKLYCRAQIAKKGIKAYNLTLNEIGE
jgi:hypothetical protein